MQLHYQILGQENTQALLILHGLFGMSDNWASLGRQLAEYYKVYLIDQRNHGKSPHSFDMNYAVMAADLAELIDDEQLENIYLMGHSMGGKTAMHFATQYPDKVAKLIIVDIAPKNYPPGHQSEFDAFNSFDPAKINRRSEADDHLKSLVPSYAVRQFMLKNLERLKEGGYRWKANLPALENNYLPIIANSLPPDACYNGTTLFIKGGKSSRYINLPDDERTIKKYFPKATISTIKNAGHWVHAEQPEIFYNTVKQFLASSTSN